MGVDIDGDDLAREAARGGKMQNPMGSKPQLQPELGELNHFPHRSKRGHRNAWEHVRCRCLASTSDLGWRRNG